MTPSQQRSLAEKLSAEAQAKAKGENAVHTPGPWVVHPTALHPAVRSVGQAEIAPRRICTVGSMNGSPVDERNARLIAAAPELLEALQGLVAVLDRQLHSPHAAPRASPLGRARAAIQKATGDTP